MRTAIVSAMVDYPVGDLIAERVKAMGVKPIYKYFKHDGVNGPNMATVLQRPGSGRAPSGGFLQPLQRSGAQLKPGDFDWKAIFAQGVRWVHCGGLFASLSATTAALAAEMMKAAKGAGAVTSFDLNYRAKLWNIQGGNEAGASRCSARSSRTLTCWWATKRTCRRGLAFRGRRLHAKSKLDPSVFFAMIDQVVKKLPKAKIVATTLREVHSTNRHSWSAVAWVNGKTVRCADGRTRRVLDRVGGGDGFASGFIYGLLTGEPPEEADQAGLGAWRASDHLPGRHHHGDAGPGARVCQGRIGTHSAVNKNHPCSASSHLICRSSPAGNGAFATDILAMHMDGGLAWQK